jgi:hypothetical protein
MAFGASATRVDNNALTNAKSIVARAVQAAKQHNGVIGALLGAVNDKAVDGYVSAERLQWTNGQKFMFPVAASNESIGTIANQAAAIAARSRDAMNNLFLSSEFNMTHFSKKWDLDNYDLDLIQGGEPGAVAGDYLTAVRDSVAVWMLNTLQTQFCTSQTQARSTLGGLPYIVDDANVYIGDRSDAAHTNIKSYVSNAAAAINLTGNVLVAQTAVQARGKYPTLGVLPTALHAKLHGQVIAAGFYTQNQTADSVGNPAFIANGTRFVLESGLDTSFSGHMYLLNEEDWKFFMNKESMAATLMDDPAGEDSRVLHMRLYAGVACLNPKRQAKITGLS